MDTDKKPQEQFFSPTEVCLLGSDAGRGDRRSGIGLPGSVFICVDLWLFRCLLLSAFSVSAFQLFSFSF